LIFRCDPCFAVLSTPYSLDEYLLDLELSVETRQQLSTTKFAEAALVLHNSSGVYSRKVDYLHSYAYRVQRDLAHTAASTTTSNDGRTNKRGSHNVGIDKEVERFLNYDPDQDFLLLDDVLPSQPEDKVNLKEDHTGDRRSSVSILDASFANNDESRTSNTTTNTTRRLSMSSLRSSTVTDSNVLRLGSILNNTEGLRLSLGKCDVDEDGLCWLPGSQGSSQPFLQQQRRRSRLSNASHLDVANSSGMVEANDNHEDGGFVPMDDGIDNHDYDDNNNDGVGFDMAAKSPTPDTKRRVTFALDVVVPPTKMPASTTMPMAVVDVEPEDPWQLLDPHVPDPTKRPRPLRMGKTLQLPPCLTRLPSQQQGRNNKNKDPIPDYLTHIALEPSTATDCANDSKSWTTGKRPREELPLRGLAYGNEFAYIAKELARRRKLRERQNKNGRNNGKMNHHGNNAGLVEADAPLLDYLDDLNRFDDGDDNDHDDDENGGGDDDGGFPNFDAAADNGGPLETNTGIASVDDLYGNYNKNVEGDEGTVHDL
jgi:hypothetical protein